MHPSLAWRSTILQIAWLGGVIALALAIKDPAIQYTLVGAFAGYGGALIQKARQSASGGNDTGSPGGLLPGPMGGGTTNPPSSMTKSALSPLSATQQLRRFALGIVMALALVAVFPNCKGASSPPPSVIAEDIKVDVNVACTTITAITSDATVALVCATAEEIAALGALVAEQFGVALDGGALKCIAAQQQTFCATPAQMQRAIQIVNARRAEAGVSP